MPDASREITATRIALLELKDEQKLVQEGYTLLDEKRILLATEIQRQLARLVALRRECAALESEMRSRTIAAVSRHGLDELSVYPPLSLAEDRLSIRRSRLLGLELLAAHLEISAQLQQSREQPVNPTPEARACAKAHRDWLVRAVELAACGVNLRRLVRDYVRTERRAKAIENILIPDIESSLKLIDGQLESMDQEEVARLRQRRKDTV
ncbi:MAG: V-type ATP synthase subunit D [Steroidobacteraceae bacterium]